MINFLYNIISPAGFTKKERREYRLGVGSCIAAILLAWMAICIF